MSQKQESRQQKTESNSSEEPEIRSRIFFKDNLSQHEPVIRSRETSRLRRR